MDESETDQVRALLRAYAESLSFGLDAQALERELAELRGAYAPPLGALLYQDFCQELRRTDLILVWLCI